LDHLSVEHLEPESPGGVLMGIDIAQPRFSWRLVPTSDTDRGVKQSAYRLVLTLGTAVVWDTDRQTSNATQLLTYNGALPLHSDALYVWEVWSWDAQGSLASSKATFRTGLFTRADWHNASWISPGFGRSLLRSPALSVPAGSLIVDATIHVAGVGYFELTVNGKRVGEGRKYDVAWTAYVVVTFF
jgi:alpha-L-rhamnosidase